MSHREEPKFRLALNNGTLLTGSDEASVRAVADSLAAAERRASRWHRDGRQAMAQLAALFPSMRGVPGTEPWDALPLLAWMCGSAPTGGSWLAARFLLGVWSPNNLWGDLALEEGFLALPEQISPEEAPRAQKWLDDQVARLNRPFDFFQAINTWDEKHAAAFMRFVAAPFFP